MKYSTLIFTMLLLAASQSFAQSVSIVKPDKSEMLESEDYNIAWEGRDVYSVDIVVKGACTPLGGKSRGEFSIFVARSVNTGNGSVFWKVPWIDAKDFVVNAKAYDSIGNLVAEYKRTYDFRPAVLANRTADGLYLSLQDRKNQRLYKQTNGRITRVYLCSSSVNYEWVPRNRHPKDPHDHDGVYRILKKERIYNSTTYEVEMPWAMRYHNGHYIHATSPEVYNVLGGPSSAGCNRLTIPDAKELFMMTPIGTRVEVIGPKG